MITSKNNKLCNILDDIVITKMTQELKGKIEVNPAQNLTLYFIYRIRHFGIDSYLLTQSGTINAENSFTESFFNNQTLNQTPILKEDELHYVIDYALTLSEVNELLSEISIPGISSCNSYKTLINIVELFNTCNIKKLSELRKKNHQKFKLLLKIALLSIPQLAAKKEYSGLYSGNLHIKGEDKYKKCKLLVNDFNERKIDNDLSARLLLLVTIIEGYLWEIGEIGEGISGGLFDFCMGNLYDILKLGIKTIEIKNESLKKEIIYNLKTHWFYLRQLQFYIYGDIKIIPEKLIQALFDVFISNLSDLILFAKSIIAKSNIDNVQKWTELSNALVPKSVAHGLLTLALPDKIGIFNLSNDREFIIIDESSFFEKQKHTSSIKELEQLNDPWALYKPCNVNINIEITKEEEKSLNENRFLVKENFLIIKTTNTLSRYLYIILEITSEKKRNEILGSFSYYRYVFKSFVEKLQDINHSAGLNLNTSFWYKKAFCNLYKDYDEIRYKKQYAKIFREWEIGKIKELVGSKSDTVIYDIGACYGRLEQKIIADNNLIKKIKKIYAIDQNKDYLQSIKKLADAKIYTYCCDFRSIGLINGEKADLICFTHTVFGYFDNDTDNELVLKKAFDMLNVDGVIIIDQFNPNEPPQHCNQSTIPVYNFPDEKVGPYSCIKTSNHSTPKKTGGNYGLYYGNYIYFDISEKNSEKIVKCDTYSIKLYTEYWFKEALGRNGLTDEKDYKIVNSEENNGTTILLTIKKLRDTNGTVGNETETSSTPPNVDM